MAAVRRSLSAALKYIQLEIQRLEKFDAENQRNYAASGLSKKQLHLLTEAIFFSSFRTYENFVRDVFLLYCMGKNPCSGRRQVKSFLNPLDFLHTENLIKSAMPFLDWSSPDTILNRSELYLKNGFPIKDAIEPHLVELREFKKIRNHIAHNSSESLGEYMKVLKKHYSVIPLTTPSPGEFLLLSVTGGPPLYKLQQFFEVVKSVAALSTNPI
ncbi:MAG: hypothetical protein LLG15_00155 [Betaproteobacteria bacterium]|nr:hypothetical protein [Betaproteobacteria bacterium]